MKEWIAYHHTFVLSLTDEREAASGFGYKRTRKPAPHQRLIKQFFDRLIFSLHAREIEIRVSATRVDTLAQ